MLDYELLESHMPFYQSALGDRLEYELTFNNYSVVVILAILYNCIHHHKITCYKNDTLWNINLNVPTGGIEGILLLFENPTAPFQWNTESFCNPNLSKVLVCIEGVPNQLYNQGLCALVKDSVSRDNVTQWSGVEVKSRGPKTDPGGTPNSEISLGGQTVT